MNLTYSGSLHSMYKISCPSSMLRSYQGISPGPRQVYLFHKKARIYGEELFAPRPTLKLEDYTLSAICDCLFNIFAATLLIRDLSSIRNPRAQITVVTGPTSYSLFHMCGLKFQRYYRLCRDYLYVLFLEKQLVS